MIISFMKVDIHIHVTRHKLSEIGSTEEDFAAWCVQRFQIKDKLMAHFEKHHEFPDAHETKKMEKHLIESGQVSPIRKE